MMHRLFSLAALGVVSLAGVANAASLLVDRGLPTANLNNAAGADRSNVAWGYGASYPEWFNGDDFTVAGSGEFRIDSLTAWFTVGDLGTNTLSTNLGAITLYGGGSQTFTALSSANFVGNATDNADVVVTEVTYDGVQNYQAPGNNFLKIFQVDFNNLNWVVNAGQTYSFGVQGVPVNVGSGLYLHASNAALSGSTQQGADNQYRAMYYDGTAYSELVNSLGNGWDKSSDVNVQISGSAVPLPSALAGGLVLMGFGLLQRRRTHQVVA